MDQVIDKSRIIKAIEKHDEAADKQRAEAARQIQRIWRMHNAARAKYMNADQRWNDAAMHARLKMGRIAAEKGKNAPRDRWKRAVFAINQLQGSNKMLARIASTDSGLPSEKTLEDQHWLELVDGKHRYGSNLKWYHRRWQKEDTEENFFKWLDQGGGKGLTLDECPRDQLERERITYLSAEQQLNYLVKIDREGKLRWAKNSKLVDTSAGRWKDAGGGQGIVPQEATDEDAPPPRSSFDSLPVTADPTLTEEEKAAAAHYAGQAKGKNKLTKILKRHFTLNGMMDRLLRMTVKKNTWIYISDKKGNIFIGIKVTGTFQHSSLSAGAVVTSAGLISVKDGVVHTLSPLSGHYRTTVKNFHEFVDSLYERHVDMSRAHISKAEIALWGVEHIKKAQKAKSNAVEKSKTKVKSAAHVVAEVVTLERHPEWKRHVLEGRQKKTPQSASTSENQGGNGDAEEAQGSNSVAIVGQSEIPIRSDPVKLLAD